MFPEFVLKLLAFVSTSSAIYQLSYAMSSNSLFTKCISTSLRTTHYKIKTEIDTWDYELRTIDGSRDLSLLTIQRRPSIRIECKL